MSKKIIAAAGLAAIVGGCEVLGFRIGPVSQPEPQFYITDWNQTLSVDPPPITVNRFENISQAIKNYVYADYERRIKEARDGFADVDLLKEAESLYRILNKHGFGEETQNIIERRRAPELADYFAEKGYSFRAITIGGEAGSFELRKILETEQVEETIMGKKANFKLVTYEDPVIMNIWDYMNMQEEGMLIIPANALSSDQVDYFPGHDNPMAKSWYGDMNAAYDRIVEGMDRSLDQLIEGMAVEPAFFVIMGRRCHVKAIGDIYENAKSEEEFVRDISKVWKEQMIIHEGMHTIDYAPWPKNATVQYLVENKSHREARSFLAEMHQANPWLALGKCYKLLVDPEKDVGPLNEHAHAAKLILWNLTAYITRYPEKFDNIDFSDFRKERSILHILKQGHKLKEDQIREAGKWIFDKLYKGKHVDEWLKESFEARGLPIRQD